MTPTSNGIGKFSATGNFDVEGNVMSLYYGDNFIGQTNLTGKNYAFKWLFDSITKVVNAKNLSLPATTLSNNCYMNMFQGCTSLVTVPKLPATTLAESCYGGMFLYCVNLTTAPELPATTLMGGCYMSMFENCTSLTTAPELPVTVLVASCYRQMFRNCTNLNSITCLANDISANNCTINWVDGVAASGTFTKAANISSWTTGANGIPTGWTVQEPAAEDLAYSFTNNYDEPSNTIELSNSEMNYVKTGIMNIKV